MVKIWGDYGPVVVAVGGTYFFLGNKMELASWFISCLSRTNLQ